MFEGYSEARLLGLVVMWAGITAFSSMMTLLTAVWIHSDIRKILGQVEGLVAR